MSLPLILIDAGITGFESPASQYSELGLCIDRLLINKPSATFITSHSGDGLTSVGLFSGDLLIVDESATPGAKDIVLISKDEDHHCVGYEQLVGNGIKFEPQIELIGVVIQSIRCHRPLNMANELPTKYNDLTTSLTDLIIPDKTASFIGKANGHSMQGFGILDGDLLIIRRSIPAQHSDIVVCNYNNNFVCKQLDKKNKMLVSSNIDYPPVPILSAGVFQLEGVVTCSIRMHRQNKRLI